MTTLLEKNALAGNPDFIARVKMAMVNTAACLPNEKYPTADHVELAVNILAYPDNYAEGFAMAVATLPGISLESSDETIQYSVNCVFDAAAGSYEYVDAGGAVMPYPVAAARGKNFTNAVVTPWYLSGGVLPANCIVAYQPKGAADLAASYINLITPGTYNAAVITAAPGWDSVNGWIMTAGGSLEALDTGVTPAATWTMVIRFTNLNLAVDYQQICGQYNNGGEYQGMYIQATRGTPAKHLYSGKGSLEVAGENASGVYCIASNTGYYNGLSEGTTGTYVNAYAAWTITIGCARYGALTNLSPECTINVQAFALYNATLTAPQVLAISTAMAAL